MSKKVFTTPVGTVKFPHIERPNQRGKYEISLTFDPSDNDFKAFIEKLTQAEIDLFPKKFRGKPHFKKDYAIIDDEKQESGLVIMRFQSGFPLWDERGSKIFDASGKQARVDIGWGSKCKVAFTMREYEAEGNIGITRYISGIQIIELSESGASAESCGFTPVDGYTYEPAKKSEGMTEWEREEAVKNNDIAWDE